jgi:uncharacterized membrane protein AbrB (regulator of aidB expression)
MWLYVFVIFGALAAVAALAVTGLGLPIAIIGGLVVAGAIFLLLASRMATAVDDADSESSKPSWMKKRYYE